jgi:hypothetical protein
VLPPEQDPRSGRRRDTVLLRFTPGSIDVFTTWQGTVLYAVLCGGLLYGLNLQQRQLAAQGLNALRPIPALSAAQAAQANLEDADRAILGAYPDLRPLGKAAAGQGLQRLRWETSQNRPDLALGLLRLELARPTRVSLRSDRGVETLLPAFLVSELKTAFAIGFRLLLPFLVLDVLVATLVVSTGLVMLPPTLVSLPLKLMVFVAADGWSLVVRSLLDGVRSVGS